MNQSLKSLVQIGGLSAVKIWWKNFNHLYHINCKACRRIYYGKEAFDNCKVRDLDQVKGKLNQTPFTAYCNITRSHLEFGLWVKDLYSCKFMTQNIVKKICAISGLQSHWTIRWERAKWSTIATHFWEILQKSWEELSSVYIQCFLERMPRYYETVITAKKKSF